MTTTFRPRCVRSSQDYGEVIERCPSHVVTDHHPHDEFRGYCDASCCTSAWTCDLHYRQAWECSE